MYQVIGTYNEKAILAKPDGAKTTAIPCAPGKGVITLGTVMVREANGMYSPAAEADCAAGKYLVVLAEDVDTAAASGIGVVASAYLSGCLLASAVHLAAEAALTADNKTALRGQGIDLLPSTSAAGFDNTTGA